MRARDAKGEKSVRIKCCCTQLTEGGSVSLSTIVLYGVSLASVVVSSHLHCYDSEAMATDIAGA